MYKEMKLVLIPEIETQEIDWLSYPYIPSEILPSFKATLVKARSLARDDALGLLKGVLGLRVRRRAGTAIRSGFYYGAPRDVTATA